MKKWKDAEFELPNENVRWHEGTVFISDGKKVWLGHYDHVDKKWWPSKETYPETDFYGYVKFWAEIELPEVPTKIMRYINEDQVRQMCSEVTNLAMSARQAQLQGTEQRSGQAILDEYLKEKLGE